MDVHSNVGAKAYNIFVDLYAARPMLIAPFINKKNHLLDWSRTLTTPKTFMTVSL